MKKTFAILLLLSLVVGCGKNEQAKDQPSSETAQNKQPSGGTTQPEQQQSEKQPSVETDTENSAPNATPPAGGNNTQTVEGSGFSFQAPADWRVLSRTSGSYGVSSPTVFKDVNNPVHGVRLVVYITPAASKKLSPKDLVASLLNVDKLVSDKSDMADVESEAQTTVSGREATKLVTTMKMRPNDTSDDVSVLRTVKVYVPLDAGVLVVHASSLTGGQVVALMPQIDAIIASIKLK